MFESRDAWKLAAIVALLGGPLGAQPVGLDAELASECAAPGDRGDALAADEIDGGSWGEEFADGFESGDTSAWSRRVELCFSTKADPEARLALAGPPAPYTVTDLGTLGGPTTQAMGINDAGQIVGPSQVGGYFYAFLWDEGTMTNLGDLGGVGSWAHGVNDAGQVVGVSQLSNFDSHAFLWQNGGMQDLGTLGGPVSYAFDINSSGQTAGAAERAEDGIHHAVLWQAGGGIVDLGDLGILWDTDSAAYGINDAGQVVGGSYTDVGDFRAFLWQSGGMQDLGSLGGDTSQAYAINENGQVVGGSKLADNTTYRAFLWDGGMQDLGSLGWTLSIAYDINDGGQVVGALQTGATSHAFVWADGQMQDLNSLIPAGSGWVLQEARAINNRGRIVGFGLVNGQTHGFLLEPRAFRWINPAGGAWSTSANWDPQGVPGAGDRVVFALAGQYSVDTTTFAPFSPTVVTEAFQVLVAGTNTVDFHGLSLNVLGDSPADPGLQVGYEGIVNIHSGAGTFVHGAIGVLPSTAPNPARLQVFNSGTTLTGTGGLTVGDLGPGDLFVANGGELVSAEGRLGGLVAAGLGTAVVGGDGSLWRTGNLAVGYGAPGTLTIETGGRVDSNDAFVSWGALSDLSSVTVDGIGAGTSQASIWALQGSLTVGQTAFGWVEVLDGGDLWIFQDAHVKNGEIRVDGRRPNGDPSDLDVLGSVFVGGPGAANLLSLLNGARGDIDGNLILGTAGPGAVGLWGSPGTASGTWLDVLDPQAGLCAVGRQFEGTVSLDLYGVFRCRDLEIGGRAGATGAGSLHVDGGMVTVLDVLSVGEVGGGSGVVDMQSDALVATVGTYISANGAILGTGTLSVSSLGLVNDGTLSPGITVNLPLAAAAAAPARFRSLGAPATLTVEGALSSGASARLEIPLAGSLPGEYGSLAVTGSASLAGALSLVFQNHYAPREGDLFTLLDVAQGVSGAFAGVEVHGLEPGFEYELTMVDGQIVLEALNDGVPEGLVFRDGFESGDTAAWSWAQP